MMVLPAVFTWAAVSWADACDETSNGALIVLRMIPAELPFVAVVVDFEKLNRNISCFVERLDIDAEEPDFSRTSRMSSILVTG